MPDRNELPLLPLGGENSPSSDLSPAMHQCALNLYRQAWEAYRDVGSPYGDTDKAMLVWYVLHGNTPGPDLVTGRN